MASCASLTTSGQLAVLRSVCHSPCARSSSWRRASLILSKISSLLSYRRSMPPGLSPGMGANMSSRMGMARVLRAALHTESVGCRRIGVMEYERAEFEERKLLAVYEQHFLTCRRFTALLVDKPLGDAAQPDLFVRLIPGERVNGGDQHLAEIHVAERRRRLNNGRGPERISQALRPIHPDGCDVFERKPHAGAGGKDFHPRSNSRIGIAQIGEGPSI